MSTQPNAVPAATPESPSGGYRSFFTSSKGKRFYAVDYGHKAWPIGKRGKPGVKPTKPTR